MCELPEASLSVHGPYLRLFEMMFDGRDVELLDVPVHLGDVPASLADADVWIATGSPASVYDDLPWIATGEELVRSAVAAERPFVGICFGHQLVAQALGGRVERASVGWGIGIRDYSTVAAVPGLRLPDTVSAIASHQDQVVVAPADAVVWSTSDYCPNAGLAVGERMWTMQGHPEFTPQLAQAIYASRRSVIGEHAVDHAMTTLTRPLSNRSIADVIAT